MRKPKFLSVLLKFLFTPLKEMGLTPLRRVIALDPGNHSLKILLLESFLGRFRIVRQEMIHLEEEGLISRDELNRHVGSILQEWGHHPLALALPQHLTLSQPIDLPPANSREIRNLIEEETLKLSGLSESAITYDYSPLEPFGRHQHSFWVTFAQEGEILSLIDRLELPPEDFREITSAANALVAAYQSFQPIAAPTLLVDVGSSSTLAVTLFNGQAVSANHFPIGGSLFTETIAAQKNCSIEAAEAFKCSQNLFAGPNAHPEFLPAIDNWHMEIERSLQDWFRDNPELNLPLEAFHVVLSGGAALQPGLVEYLNQKSRLHFIPWPEPQKNQPSSPFAIAFGTALLSFGKSAQPASLLPANLRRNWKKQNSWQNIQSATFYLLLVLALLLGAGTWQQISLLNGKNQLLAQAGATLEKARATEELATQLFNDYERVRPILERQQFTRDTLHTLAQLQQARSDQKFWFVLFSDPLSYFRAQPFPEIESNGRPNLRQPFTNGFIVELCVPEQGQAMRDILARLVNTLQEDPSLERVDSLRPDLRRDLVSPDVLLPDRHFTLAIELAPNQFAKPPLKITPPATQSSPASTNSSTGKTFRQRSLN